MDPVSAVGLAAAIVQFLEIGTKVVRRLSDFGDAVDDTPKAFRQIKTILPLIVDGLRRIQSNVSAGIIDAETQRALVPVLDGCLAETEKLDRTLDKALPAAGSSSWDRRAKALLSLRYDKTIEQIADSLDRFMTTLTFHQVTDNFHNLRVESQEPAAPKAFWLVPFDRNALFVGRDKVFDDIADALAVPEGSQPKAALCGLGGIGKSQIALEYCFRTYKRDTGCSIFWVHAATIPRFEESITRIAKECGLLGNGEARNDALSLLKDWLELRLEGPWLMVLDNVDDEEAFFHEKTRAGKTLSECIPRCARGSLLFTTRNRDIAFDVANPAQPIIIHGMGKEEGLELARKRLPSDAEEHALLELLDVLEYIPLAITQAVAFMTKRRKSVQQYLEQYKKNDATKLKMLDFDFSDHGRYGGLRESVAKTWTLSFDFIRAHYPEAAELLCLMSFFQHQGIPAVLLQPQGQDDFDFESAVAVLKGFSFVDADDADSVFRTHRLVQIATRWWLDKESPSETDQWAVTALHSIASRFPNSSKSASFFNSGEVLIPHAELMLSYEMKQPPKEFELERARLLHSSGKYAMWMGNYEIAVSRMRESREVYLKTLGEKDLKTMDITESLGLLLTKVYAAQGAVPLLERLVEVRRETSGEDSQPLTSAKSILAVALRRAGYLTRAETMQREAIEWAERVLGRDHHNTVIYLGRLTKILRSQGRIGEATKLRMEIYENKKKRYGPMHPLALSAETNLAILLGDNEETTAEAIELLKHNIELWRLVFGADHRETLVSINHCVSLLRQQGRLEEARDLCLRAMADARGGPRRQEPITQGALREIELELERIEGMMREDNPRFGEIGTTSEQKDASIRPAEEDGRDQPRSS